MSQRSRKYIYETADWANIEKIKGIECAYHIIGTETPLIKGFIYFKNAKTDYEINALINKGVVKPTKETLQKLQTHYRRLDDVWESTKEPESNAITKVADTRVFEENRALMEMVKNTQQQVNILTQALTDAVKNISAATTNNIVINNGTIKTVKKKYVNIQIFLNEECKDAISLRDFVRGVQVEEEDLHYANNHGFCEAISRLFEKGLKNFDVRTRPLHCSDVKREVLHIKDQDRGWIKDDMGSPLLQKAIDTMSNKQMQRLCKFVQENPEYKDVRHPNYEEYLFFMKNSMGGGHDDDRNGKVIARKLAKMVHMDKKVIE
jgi:hypothetical protein